MLRTVCIVAVSMMLCIALGELAWTMHTVRPHLIQTVTDLDRTVIIAGGAARDVELGARQWQTASSAQLAATQNILRGANQALSNVNAGAAALTTFISRTDKSLNDGLFSEATSVLATQASELSSNQTKLSESLSTLTKTLTDADTTIASPQIANSLSNIEASTLNLNAGIKNLTGVTADAKDAADYELAQLKKPIAVWRRVLQFVLSSGSDARVLFTGGK